MRRDRRAADGGADPRADAPVPDDRPRPLLALTLVALQVLAAASVWLRVFPPRDVLPVIVTAALAPAAIGALLPSRRRGWPGVVLDLAVFGGAGVVLLATSPGGSVGRAGSDVATGLVHGWDDLLSTVVPVSGVPPLLAVPYVLTWLASLTATQLVTRTGAVVAPAVPALLLLVAARLFAPVGAATSWGAAAGVTLAGIVLIAVRNGGQRAVAPDASATVGRAGVRGDPMAGDEDRAPAARRAGLLALPIAVVVVLVALGAGPGATNVVGRPAVSLRELREPNVRVPPAADPLDSFTATLSSNPDAVRFTVDSSAPRDASARWLLVALDRFDGSAWSSSARYRRAGTELPAGAAASDPAGGDAIDERDLPGVAGVTTSELRQTIEIGDLQGVWLPAATRPVELHLPNADDRAAVDPSSGTLILDGATLHPGLRYSVTSAISTPTAAALGQAALPTSAAFRRDIELPPGLPAPINDATTTAMARAASPFQQAAALEAWFHGNGFTFDATAPTGHSYGDLVRFLGTGKNAKRGTDEQFASAYVVMARARGLPARVAVGFRRGTPVEGASATGGVQYRVTAADTAVWPEVYFAGLGWVPFDPVPSAGSAPPPPQDPVTEEVATGKARAAEAAATNQSVPPAGNPILERAPADDASRPWWVWVLAVAAVVVVVLVAVRVLVALRRRRRARRRRAARREAREPAARVLGAWHEVVELLEASGMETLSSSTVADVGTAVAARWGDVVAAPVRALGALVNDAAFEPEPPSDAVADQAWRLEAEARERIVAARRATGAPASGGPLDDGEGRGGSSPATTATTRAPA